MVKAQKKQLYSDTPAGKDSAHKPQSRDKGRKLSEYGTQLQEKQKVKQIYGVREKQFVRMFEQANRSKTAPGELLLSMLERRLDNVVYRLKLSTTRVQARQIIVHGHVRVNGAKVTSPSVQVTVGDSITIAPDVLNRTKFLEEVIDKRLNIAVKVPDWLELNKQDRTGIVLRDPVRADIQYPIQEHYIVELYSK